MLFLEILKAILFGIVEGITEWLPISSTGHMILLNEFVTLDVTKDFWDMFLVVIQLGAILAVVLLYWHKLWPFGKDREGIYVKQDIFSMWFKIIAACIPAAIVGILFEEQLDKLFYNSTCVAIALIVFGILFIVVENVNRGKRPSIRSIADISYPVALGFGMFQLIAAVFPGTSRSGATILGGLLLGCSRKVSAQFTFFLAIPVMFGASLLKIVKFGGVGSGGEIAILVTGLVVAFLVSVFVIRFLMGYIKKHDFKVFGWYRIVLGCIVLGYFWLLA